MGITAVLTPPASDVSVHATTRSPPSRTIRGKPLALEPPVMARVNGVGPDGATGFMASLESGRETRISLTAALF